MIYETLICITDEINSNFKRKLQTNEEKAILSGIVNQDGTVAIQGENKIIVTLLNVEKDTIGRTTAGSSVGVTTPNTAPAVNINLYVLFSAYFSSSNYPEALRFLSFVVAHFQAKNVFTRANTPAMDPRIGKLIFEMESLGADKLNNVWTTLGAKYMPSVVYKVRMLTFDDSIIREYRPVVDDISGNVGPA